MLPARRNVNERWDVAAQVKQGVHLHRRLGASEMRPREDREAQVDGGGVERVDGVAEICSEAVIGMQVAGGPDQGLGEVGVDAPVASLVRLGQRGARDRAAEAHVVELSGLRAGRSRCRAGSPWRSVGRMPCCGTGRDS